MLEQFVAWRLRRPVGVRPSNNRRSATHKVLHGAENRRGEGN